MKEKIEETRREFNAILEYVPEGRDVWRFTRSKKGREAERRVA